jgi:hypothetical protein
MATIATTAQTADSIDYYGAHPSQSESKRKPPWDRRIMLSAIGQRLKDQYALAPPVPPQLAALVEQLRSAEIGMIARSAT